MFYFMTSLHAAEIKIPLDIVNSNCHVGVKFLQEDFAYNPNITALNRTLIELKEDQQTYYESKYTKVSPYVFGTKNCIKDDNIFTFDFTYQKNPYHGPEYPRSSIMIVDFKSTASCQSYKKKFEKNEFAYRTGDDGYVEKISYTCGQKWVQLCYEKVKYCPYIDTCKAVFNINHITLINNMGLKKTIYNSNENEEIFDFIWNDNQDNYSVLLYCSKDSLYKVKSLGGAKGDTEQERIVNIDLKLDKSELITKPSCMYFVNKDWLSYIFFQDGKGCLDKTHLIVGLYNVAEHASFNIVDLAKHQELQQLLWPLIEPTFEKERLAALTIHGHYRERDVCSSMLPYDKIEIMFSHKKDFDEGSSGKNNEQCWYQTLYTSALQKKNYFFALFALAFTSLIAHYFLNNLIYIPNYVPYRSTNFLKHFPRS